MIKHLLVEPYSLPVSLTADRTRIMGHVPDSLCWDDATTAAAAAVCRTRSSDRWRRRDGLTGMMVEEAAGGQTLRGRDGVVDLRLGNVNVLRSKLRRLNLRNSKYSYINVSIIEKLFQLGTKKTSRFQKAFWWKKRNWEDPLGSTTPYLSRQ